MTDCVSSNIISFTARPPRVFIFTRRFISRRLFYTNVLSMGNQFRRDFRRHETRSAIKVQAARFFIATCNSRVPSSESIERGFAGQPSRGCFVEGDGEGVAVAVNGGYSLPLLSRRWRRAHFESRLVRARSRRSLVAAARPRATRTVLPFAFDVCQSPVSYVVLVRRVTCDDEGRTGTGGRAPSEFRRESPRARARALLTR